MTEGVSRTGGLADLSIDDRRRLRAELDFARDLLRRIDRGAGFCEDRGFGWTAGMERAEGSDRLLAALRDWPILRRLLPQLRHLRHQPDPVIGLGTVPHDDVTVALALVDGQWSFRGQYGEGWGVSTAEVAFEPQHIRISAQTDATRLSGEPFDHDEWVVAYADGDAAALRARLSGKLPEDEVAQACLLAGRMRAAIVPCDLCGRTVQSFSIDGPVLTIAGPGAAPVQAEVPAASLLRLRQAMAAQDMPGIGALDPAWVRSYDAGRDASYCQHHCAHV